LVQREIRLADLDVVLSLPVGILANIQMRPDPLDSFLAFLGVRTGIEHLQVVFIVLVSLAEQIEFLLRDRQTERRFGVFGLVGQRGVKTFQGWGVVLVGQIVVSNLDVFVCLVRIVVSKRAFLWLLRRTRLFGQRGSVEIDLRVFAGAFLRLFLDRRLGS